MIKRGVGHAEAQPGAEVLLLGERTVTSFAVMREVLMSLARPPMREE